MKVNIPLDLNVSLYKTQTISFLVFKKNTANNFFYLKCPNNTTIIKKNQTLLFVAKSWNFYYLLSIKLLNFKLQKLFKKDSNKLYHKKLILKGLGFKILNIVQNDFIELKLGFSHLLKINIPSKYNLTIYSNKNMIIIEGLNKDLVGNFATKIKSYRMPDIYKGKGIWYKGESKMLKEVKKT